jgi:cyclopropane fatty-acyl-phospholipid synthase-like methyltransferase
MTRRKGYARDLNAGFFDEEWWERGGGTRAGYNGITTLEGMNKSFVKEFLPIWGLKKGDRLLDLGWGAGWFVRYCLDAGIDACGIDISAYAIARGRELYELDDRIVEGSIHDLSVWPDGHFDFLYSQQVFEHLPERYADDLIAECRRVHKPGGAMWVGLVLRPPQMSEDDAHTDREPTHITVKHRGFWDARFMAAGYRLYPALEVAMIEKSTNWQSLRWDQLAYYLPDEEDAA